jgi:Ala-tRNA(Pro) deacylase
MFRVHVPRIFFGETKKGSINYLIVVESSKTVDLLKIAEIVEDFKLGFASPERLFNYLRTTPGSVSPFGLIFDRDNHVQVLVDRDLLASEQVHFHPNDNTKTWLISGADLRRYFDSVGNSWVETEF